MIPGTPLQLGAEQAAEHGCQHEPHHQRYQRLLGPRIPRRSDPPTISHAAGLDGGRARSAAGRTVVGALCASTPCWQPSPAIGRLGVCLALVAEHSLYDSAEKEPATSRWRRRASAFVRHPEGLRRRRLRRPALQLQPRPPLLDSPRLGPGTAAGAPASPAPPEAPTRRRFLRERRRGPWLPLVAFVPVRAASSIGRAVPS